MPSYFLVIDIANTEDLNVLVVRLDNTINKCC